ncbi:hypothetical protein HMPREF9156_00995 [Scardovia wiggsiae F0424]|uniref:NADH:flavin oxidoreductase/NADH oxidase N-terminal domain-containing protein n=1 Tax=Scardovia wiggsiae F0424 TaxID=857290 RepID=J0D3L1_9BIFI|nr:NADH:flavin oxidoreductase/NADH oxidase [Scardovia wiggsiae]EJD64500.1 hypothetical protein HMPREF9156_00995 [Scardovia wiggsiae F0424]
MSKDKKKNKIDRELRLAESAAKDAYEVIDRKALKEAKRIKTAAKHFRGLQHPAGKAPDGKQPRPHLFEPISIRSVTSRNRIWLPPMDMYSVFARDGKPTSFHYQHYVSRALGGFGTVIAESTAVSPEGRISPYDTGLWDDEQIGAWSWIADGIRQAGAVPAIQINHAGRKGSSGCSGLGYINASVPAEAGGWETVGATDTPFNENFAPSRGLSSDEIHQVVGQFRSAAERARAAGFDMVEIHGAHGYLISQFMDPLINNRTDEYGGSFANRIRFAVEVADAVREVWPDSLPVVMRLSATDWVEGGWDLYQSVELAKVLKNHGIDMIDVSTGAIISGAKIPAKPNYQVPFAQEIRAKADIPVTAVGLITKPKQAEKILEQGRADAVEIGRAALRDPYWPLRAAAKLGLDRHDAPYPVQYARGAYGITR